MKKWFWILLLVPATVVFAQTWDDLWTENQQMDRVFQARALLQGCTAQILETIDQVQTIKDSGVLDTIPADKKTALNDWLTTLKACKTALMANPGIVEAYQWAP